MRQRYRLTPATRTSAEAVSVGVTDSRVVILQDGGGVMAASPAVPPPHPRGLYQEHDNFDGLVTLSIYNCAGRLLERSSIVADCLTPERLEQARSMLEENCPADPHLHGRVCPSARRRFMRLVAENHRVLDGVAATRRAVSGQSPDAGSSEPPPPRLS